MKHVYGWALPDEDIHFEKYLEKSEEVFGRRIYQGPHIQTALSATKARRVALDIGAHVGFWSFYLAKYFAEVHAFEPVRAFGECFRENVKDRCVLLHETALGNRAGFVEMEVLMENSGMTHVKAGVKGSTPIEALDAFGIADVDLVKIDVEGYERFVLEGARRTLLRNKPVVIVEQKSGSDRYSIDKFAALRYLERLGAEVMNKVVDDFILGWPTKP